MTTPFPSSLSFALLALLASTAACGGSTFNPLPDAGKLPSVASGGSGEGSGGGSYGDDSSGPTSETLDGGGGPVVATGSNGLSSGSGSGGSGGTTVAPTQGEPDAGDGCGVEYCEPDGGPCSGECDPEDGGGAVVADPDASSGECVSYCAAGACGMSDGCFGLCGCAPGETCGATGHCQ